jgi:penicillin-binding protein 1A
MATRSPIRRSTVHRALPQPVPIRRRKRFRRLRRALTTVLVGALGVALTWGYVLQVYAPGLRSEASLVPAQVHAELARRGAPYVPLSGISPTLRQAIVAIEDRRFYHHFGVDPLGLLRAVWVNLNDQHVDQGGSTLEEQLVKRAIVHDDRPIHAKLRTMALAWAVDQEFSKGRILELYLNAAYYGQGAYGAAAAARIYFGTDVSHLTLPQAAFLAALPQAPSIYGAQPRSRAILERQKTVLRDMEAMNVISAAEERRAERAPLVFALPNPQ